jgi:hypothetical protein
VAHWSLAMPFGSGGGAATPDLGSLAVFSVRVLRGEVCGREGDFIAAWGRGNRNEIMRIKARRSRSPQARFLDEG